MKRLSRPYLIISLLMCFTSLLFSQEEVTGDITAKIDISTKGDFTQFTATAYNTTEINKSLRYEFVVVQQGSSDANENRAAQNGYEVISTGIRKVLSSQTVVINKKQKTIAFLLLYDEKQKLVGKDRVVINGLNGNDGKQALVISKDALQQQLEEEEKRDGVVLRGVVIQDTKTKPGNDFYREYYSQYLSNNINGEQIVTIKEELALGSNTRIKVLVEQQVILEFFLNPRASFIEQMAGQAIFRTNRYFRDLQKNKNLQKRY